MCSAAVLLEAGLTSQSTTLKKNLISDHSLRGYLNGVPGMFVIAVNV